MTITERFACTAPEAQGVHSSAVLKFVEAVERKKLEMHSFMLVRHGVKIAEGWWQPFAPHHPHMLFSLSKSFTSSAVGLAVAEGRLSLADPVISFFPDDLPDQVSPNLAAMQIKHLLTMSTGHAEDTTGHLRSQSDGNWVKRFLSLPVENPPGMPFVYNSGATYMLSAIVQKVTGQTLLEYLTPRLFEPLGIRNPTWETCPRGISTGGWGLSIRTEDIACFGQMLLNKGRWNGTRILPESWVEAATSAQVSNGSDPESDWAQGYGYQFWRCRHNIYRGDGAFGQYCIVMPDQDAVLAITSGLGDMQAVLNLVWRWLLPAMNDKPLRANPRAEEKLAEKTAHLALPDPAGAASSPHQSSLAGGYKLKPNPLQAQHLSLQFLPGAVNLAVQFEQGTAEVTAGLGTWKFGSTSLTSPVGKHNNVAAMCTWLTPDRLQMTLRFYETPFTFTFLINLQGSTLVVRQSTNVAFGPRHLPTLRGWRQ